MDSIPKLEKLNEAKQAEYRRAAETYSLAQEARAHLPGLRYQLAQGPVVLAARLTPNHRALWRTVSRGRMRPGGSADAPPITTILKARDLAYTRFACGPLRGGGGELLRAAPPGSPAVPPPGSGKRWRRRRRRCGPTIAAEALSALLSDPEAAVHGEVGLGQAVLRASPHHATAQRPLDQLNL